MDEKPRPRKLSPVYVTCVLCKNMTVAHFPSTYQESVLLKYFPWYCLNCNVEKDENSDQQEHTSPECREEQNTQEISNSQGDEGSSENVVGNNFPKKLSPPLDPSFVFVSTESTINFEPTNVAEDKKSQVQCGDTSQKVEESTNQTVQTSYTSNEPIKKQISANSSDCKIQSPSHKTEIVNIPSTSKANKNATTSKILKTGTLNKPPNKPKKRDFNALLQAQSNVKIGKEHFNRWLRVHVSNKLFVRRYNNWYIIEKRDIALPDLTSLPVDVIAKLDLKKLKLVDFFCRQCNQPIYRNELPVRLQFDEANVIPIGRMQYKIKCKCPSTSPETPQYPSEWVRQLPDDLAPHMPKIVKAGFQNVSRGFNVCPRKSTCNEPEKDHETSETSPKQNKTAIVEDFKGNKQTEQQSVNNSPGKDNHDNSGVLENSQKDNLPVQQSAVDYSAKISEKVDKENFDVGAAQEVHDDEKK